MDRAGPPVPLAPPRRSRSRSRPRLTPLARACARPVRSLQTVSGPTRTPSVDSIYLLIIVLSKLPLLKLLYFESRRLLPIVCNNIKPYRFTCMSSILFDRNLYGSMD